MTGDETELTSAAWRRGILTNPHTQEVSGQIGVDVICFDKAGQPIFTTGSFAAQDSVPAGGTASFRVEFHGEPCPQFLPAASGYALRFNSRGLRSRPLTMAAVGLAASACGGCAAGVTRDTPSIRGVSPPASSISRTDPTSERQWRPSH